MNSVREKSVSSPVRAPLILALGDGIALLSFVILGRISHGFTSDWIVNVLRISTPFLLGWFVLALLLGAYRLDLLSRPSVMMGRSALAWIGGNLVAFAIRAWFFQNNVTLPFALTSIAFTGLFLLGWRALYLWWVNRR